MSSVCNPNSTTGILPIMEYLEKERGENLFFLTSNLFYHSTFEKGVLESLLSEVTNRILAETYKHMGASAILPGIRDTIQGIDDYKKMTAEMGLEPVCANLVYQESLKPAFTPYIIIENRGLKIGVTGLMSKKLIQANRDESEGELGKVNKIGNVAVASLYRNDKVDILDPVATAASVASELKSQGADFIIALSSISIIANKNILNSTDVDLVIGNDVCKKDGYDTEKGGVRIHTETLANSLGKFDYYFPPNTTGIRGDKSAIKSVQTDMAKVRDALDQIFQRYGTDEDQAIKNLSSGTEDYAIFRNKSKKLIELEQRKAELTKECKDSYFTNEYIPTGKIHLAEGGSAWKTWFDFGDQLEPAAKGHEKEIISEVKPLIDQTEMTIKPETCAACHPAQHEHWKGTAHGSSFDSIVRMNGSHNPICAKCHTSGYCRKNGFVILPPPAELASVNCDVCHRAASKHVVDCFSPPEPLPVNNAGEILKFCRQCHDTQVSPQFKPVVNLTEIACPSIDYSSQEMMKIFHQKETELSNRISPDGEFQNIEDYAMSAYVKKRLNIDIEERIEILRRGNRKDPYDRKIILMLYPLLAKIQDNAGALEIMETYISKNQSDAVVNLEVIRMLILSADQNVHNPELCREYIRWWLSNLGQDNIEVYLLLAMADAELGFIEEGLDALDKVQESSPSAEQATMMQQLRARFEELLQKKKQNEN
ncbi:MAG: multiheme c-type cytochrome [Planctomycetota bacterium]